MCAPEKRVAYFILVCSFNLRILVLYGTRFSGAEWVQALTNFWNTIPEHEG